MFHPRQTRFSIIVPIYNVQEYLSKCLLSIKEQTFDNYEIICINDGSTDNSLSIAESFKRDNPNLCITIISQNNCGVGEARNKGLNYATGDYIWFIDSDDYIAPNALHILSNAISENPDMVMFSCKKIGKEFQSQNILHNAEFKSGWNYFESLAKNNYNISFVSVCCRIFRRELLTYNRINFISDLIHEDVLFTP